MANSIVAFIDGKIGIKEVHNPIIEHEIKNKPHSPTRPLLSNKYTLVAKIILKLHQIPRVQGEESFHIDNSIPRMAD